MPALGFEKLGFIAMRSGREGAWLGASRKHILSDVTRAAFVYSAQKRRATVSDSNRRAATDKSHAKKFDSICASIKRTQCVVEGPSAVNVAQCTGYPTHALLFQLRASESKTPQVYELFTESTHTTGISAVTNMP
ncbi:ribosomal protein S4 [Aspergillus niger]|uniref:Ribosomal protein S4 n=1 Tax=Aspergillus niger TaxID=5061 RepID=A0A505I5D0_ASPNG|nr:uncharacterized protein BO96DRAFT_141680 [Aspergillus niger CBS 101883]PYH60515.1 hypothetical protein BO96DRAFT_141680 [Aspergillus niger CBS 101883]TPR08476.1 ribosomal protein S4 [Aspergillus niger]